MDWSRQLVFTVNDRPHYLAETLDSWRRVRGVKDWPVTFHVEPTHYVRQQIDLIGEFGSNVQHKAVAVQVNPKKYGVLHNPWTALEGAFTTGAEFTVLGEEDVIVSDDALEYMDWARQFFADDVGVLGVCGFTHADGKEEEVTTRKDFCPVLWGTWKDRWENELRDTWDHDYSTGDGNAAGWDWNIRLRIMGNRRFVFPEQSRSNHIGYHGVHMQPEWFESSQSKSFREYRDQQQYRWVDVP